MLKELWRPNIKERDLIKMGIISCYMMDTECLTGRNMDGISGIKSILCSNGTGFSDDLKICSLDRETTEPEYFNIIQYLLNKLITVLYKFCIFSESFLYFFKFLSLQQLRALKQQEGIDDFVNNKTRCNCFYFLMLYFRKKLSTILRIFGKIIYMIHKDICINKDDFIFIKFDKIQCLPPVDSYSERISSEFICFPFNIPEVSLVISGLSIRNLPILSISSLSPLGKGYFFSSEIRDIFFPPPLQIYHINYKKSRNEFEQFERTCLSLPQRQLGGNLQNYKEVF